MATKPKTPKKKGPDYKALLVEVCRSLGKTEAGAVRVCDPQRILTSIAQARITLKEVNTR